MDCLHFNFHFVSYNTWFHSRVIFLNFVFSGSLHEVLEYCSAGSLYDFLRDNKGKLENAYEMLLGMAIDIAEGMQFIEKYKVCIYRKYEETN